jgi:hypothetical protein
VYAIEGKATLALDVDAVSNLRVTRNCIAPDWVAIAASLKVTHLSIPLRMELYLDIPAQDHVGLGTWQLREFLK